MNKNLCIPVHFITKIADELEDYYSNLTKLIEETYHSCGNRKVIIIAHSMGNPLMLYFYNSIVVQVPENFFPIP